ncbi:MAG: hypothetical protein ACFFFK_09755 [Candidatus Thorarchaeota archaeon]
MQEVMFTIPIPPLLALGFLIGIVLYVLGYREQTVLTRRYHLMGLGLIIIGIMIPISPLSWYLYWFLTSVLILGLIDIAIIAVTLILGIVFLYIGFKTYTKSQ